jgi:hypothetical protein
MRVRAGPFLLRRRGRPSAPEPVDLGGGHDMSPCGRPGSCSRCKHACEWPDRKAALKTTGTEPLPVGYRLGIGIKCAGCDGNARGHNDLPKAPRRAAPAVGYQRLAIPGHVGDGRRQLWRQGWRRHGLGSIFLYRESFVFPQPLLGSPPNLDRSPCHSKSAVSSLKAPGSRQRKGAGRGHAPNLRA